MVHAVSKRILIVEDDPALRSAIRSFLESALHAEIQEAECGNTAIELMEYEAFDLVISDLDMSNGNGTKVHEFMQINRYEAPLIFFNGKAKQTFDGRVVIEKPELNQLITEARKALLPKK